MAIDHSFKHGTLLPVVHQATPTLHNANYVEVFFVYVAALSELYWAMNIPLWSWKGKTNIWSGERNKLVLPLFLLNMMKKISYVKNYKKKKLFR